MARINIEDSIFKDARFIDLCIYHGDKQKALGALTWAFIIAQKHFLNEENDRLIPLDEWNAQGCDNKLIELGLAEKRENGVYVKGSEKHFSWLNQRSLAGKSRSKNKIEQLKNARLKKSITVERPLNGTERPMNGSEPLTLSLTLNTNTTTTNASLAFEGGKLTDQVSECWKVWNETLQHFRIPPKRITPSQESSIARAIKSIGLENAKLALEGQRYEGKHEGFDPAMHLSVDRCLHRDGRGQSKWEKLANLALLKHELKSKELESE